LAFSGVPITLRTGKRSTEKYSEIVPYILSARPQRSSLPSAAICSHPILLPCVFSPMKVFGSLSSKGAW